MGESDIHGEPRKRGEPDIAEMHLGAPTRHWMVPILVALIGAFMSILDSSIVNVAIATIMRIFSTTTSVVQWVSTIYLLALGVVVPMSGWLGDRLGFKRLYMLSMAVFVLGSMLCTASWSINALIAARVIQALGGGMIMPTTMAMVYRMVPKDRIGRAMGIFGIALLVAPAIGPTLGGYLVEYVDWRWIFTINLPIGIVGLLLSYFLLPEFETAPAGKFDYPGAASSAIGLFALLLAFSKGADWGWRSESTVMLFYLGVASLVMFVIIELTSPNPLLDLRVFKYPVFTFANLTIVVTVIGMYAGLFYLPLFLQAVRGLGALKTGLLMMPGALLSGLVMPISGRLYDRIGPRPLVVTGLLLLAVLTYTFHNLSLYTPVTTVMVWVMFRGLVMSFANMPAQTASIAVIPQALIGRASALTNIISRVASSFGLAVLTSIMTRRTAFHTAQLADRVTTTNAAAVDLLNRTGAAFGGGAAGHTAAIAYLFGLVQKLAYVSAIDDVFIVAAGLTLIGLVPALFLKRGNQRVPAPAEA
ncbi:MAG TPA: DHA2 family efflux MFS transporter permease subunit [Spirochaetia bacterium]|nr:DHA2 family efflux MFS transporter permease subunit [Spirochaetia bacterium]